ncbi:MAG: alcohol dehydrogenase catalytic domain-containing protein [Anaerolineae bacterium]|nr:alcohol dehydrogenase catalytic domain-containing protein [Anaerolineae bacterium]
MEHNNTMRGVVFIGNGKVELRNFPKPTPRGTQVVVKMKAAGICGSDMHSFYRSQDFWAQHPIIRGHEPSGIIEAVGEAVTMVQPGDRVSVYHAPACGHCEACVRGEYFRCTTIGPGYRLASLKVHGCDADFLLVDQNVCFPLPDSLSFEDGAIIACAGGTAYHALKKADVHAGEYVLVTGLGPVGLCVTLLANAMGAFVIGADPIAYRRELAKHHGATYTLDPAQENLAEKVKQIVKEGVEVAIETSGNDQARADILQATNYHSRLVYVGFGGQTQNIMLSPLLGDRMITGSNMFTGADYYDLTRFLLRKQLHFDVLVTHRFPLERAQEAFDLFATKQTGKVVFTWD